MPVGVSAQAAAIAAAAHPRPGDRGLAAVSTPASAAAASSPTLWPAVDADRRLPAGRSSSAAASQRGGHEQRLGHRGVTDLVRVGGRAEPDQIEAGDADSQRSRSAARAGRATGARKPGVWAPWPGARMTSTPPPSRLPGSRYESGDARSCDPADL